MRFAATYVILKLRALFRSKIYIGFGVFMLLLAAAMALLLPRVDQNSAYTVAMLNEHQTQLGTEVAELLSRDGGYHLRICRDRRELEALVLSGEALCGYAFAQDADERVQKGRYTNLADSFYREKSPASALCDEAVYGAVFNAISPAIAESSLVQHGFTREQVRGFGERFAAAASEVKPMKIVILGSGGEAVAGGNESMLTTFLYSIFCSLIAVFAIITAFYTHSIDKSLAFAGNSPALVGLCSFVSYFVSYLAILSAVHLVTACFLPTLLTDSRLLWQLLTTALAGGVLQMFSRRFLSPAIIPLLPFAAVLMVAVTSF